MKSGRTGTLRRFAKADKVRGNGSGEASEREGWALKRPRERRTIHPEPWNYRHSMQIGRSLSRPVATVSSRRLPGRRQIARRGFSMLPWLTAGSANFILVKA